MRSASTLLMLMAISAAACQVDRSGLGGPGGGAGASSNARGSTDASGATRRDDGAASDDADTSGEPGSGGAAGADGGAGGRPTTPPGCTPGVQGTLIIDCGYPTPSVGQLGSVMFNESEILRAIQPVSSSTRGIVRVFYNDEHALTLGVRSVVVKSAAGTTTTNYPVSPLPSALAGAIAPQIGSTELVGDRSGLDASLRPMWPSLFITDLTFDPSSRAGDWQAGGTPHSPNAVFGTWKAAVRMVDTTKPMVMVSITPDPDPPKNGWMLPGGDPVPAGLVNEGFGAEIRWDVDLIPGHSYRVQIIVHDGDQNRMGGDAGAACIVFCAE